MAKRDRLTEQLRRAVDASDMTRYRIAKELGIEQSSMSRFMSGGGMRTERLERLIELLDLEVVVRPKRGPKKKGR